jgi:uncharacterized protein with WD repeat
MLSQLELLKLPSQQTAIVIAVHFSGRRRFSGLTLNRRTATHTLSYTHVRLCVRAYKQLLQYCYQPQQQRRSFTCIKRQERSDESNDLRAKYRHRLPPAENN